MMEHTLTVRSLGRWFCQAIIKNLISLSTAGMAALGRVCTLCTCEEERGLHFVDDFGCFSSSSSSSTVVHAAPSLDILRSRTYIMSWELPPPRFLNFTIEKRREMREKGRREVSKQTRRTVCEVARARLLATTV